MPKRNFVSMRKATWAFLVSVAMSSAPIAWAQSSPDIVDSQIRDAIRRLDSTLRAGPDPEIKASTLIQNSGLTAFTGAPAVGSDLLLSPRTVSSLDRVSAREMDVRISLGQIAQLYGAGDNTVVVNAQSSSGLRALVIDRGVVTMDNLFDLAGTFGLQSDGGAGQNLLKVPLVIGADATLALRPGDVLRLSRPDGAFVANFGRLEVVGATIEGVGPQNAMSGEFVPFVVNAGGASVVARNSHFRTLGFGPEPKFGGFAVVRNPLLVRRDEVVIEGNVFEALNSVALSLADNVVIRDNRFRNSRAAALIISRSQNAQVLSNVFFGPLPITYGRIPTASNAIRVNLDSQNALIAGNLIIHGYRAGIAVRTRSHFVRIENNVVYNRGGAGTTLKDVQCGVVQNNVVIDNHQKGIEIRTGLNMVVRDNLLLGNRSPGVFLADQSSGEATLIQGNTFVGNGAGLGSAAGETFALVGNNFVKQFPRFVQGDLANQTQEIVGDLRGESPLVLTAGGPLNVPVPNVSCNE